MCQFTLLGQISNAVHEEFNKILMNTLKHD